MRFSCYHAESPKNHKFYDIFILLFCMLHGTLVIDISKLKEYLFDQKVKVIESLKNIKPYIPYLFYIGNEPWEEKQNVWSKKIP